MTIRRLKTYTGSQGYVYQYYFVGKRPAVVSGAKGSDANEYIFDVTSDRKLTYAVSIFLPHWVVAGWAEGHGRPSLIPSSTPPSRCGCSALSMNWKKCWRKAGNCRSTCSRWKNRWRRWAWNRVRRLHTTRVPKHKSFYSPVTIS